MKAGSFTKKGDAIRFKREYFTGKVVPLSISGTPKPKEANVLHVKFYGSCRTKMHRHTGGQMLIVTGGSGSLITYSGAGRKNPPFTAKMSEKTPLREGSVVYIPAGTLHTHGSVKKTGMFSHIAINFTGPRGLFKTSWYESDPKGRVTAKI